MRFLWAVIILSLACYCFVSPTYAKKKIKHQPVVVYDTQNLIAEINRAIYGLPSKTEVGIIVKSMKFGDTLYTKNAQQLMVPASILKVMTAEAALIYLGPEYRFQTTLLTDASSINNGTLHGNVYLVHSGDPTLTDDDFVDLMTALKSQNIQRIEGNVYIDTSAYDQDNFGPGWDEKDTKLCFGAPISASIINHNCKGLVKQSKTMVVNDIIQYNQILLGTLFKEHGIQITGTIQSGIANNHLFLLAKHDSQPLDVLVKKMLKKSDNIIAGSLFKKLGSLVTRSPGSWKNGSYAVTQILTQRANVDTSQITLQDGSGLSRYNKISPQQMIQTLDFAYHNQYTNYALISALPIAGVDGTLKKRLFNISGKARAKTGTMSGVVALAGYAISANKEPIAFVIILNGRNGMGWAYRSIEDRIVTALVRYSRA